jgi:singapore isolate B (sub-type 7) whole genome shotgun sequence assembly, scaffold_1
MTHPDMIAIVALAPSEVSYYDNKTGIRLNAANRYAPIFKDMDIINIRRSVKVGRLMLVNGVLPGEQKQGVLGKILKSSSYDMVAPGIVTEEAVNKALEEKETPDFDVDAALKEAEENAKQVAEVKEPVVEKTEETSEEIQEESTEEETENIVEETEDITEESEDKEEAPKKASKKKTSAKKTTKK